MATTDAQAVLRVPARDVPVPSFLSLQAQAILGMGLLEIDEYPPLEDLDGWRAMVASRDELVRSIMVGPGVGLRWRGGRDRLRWRVDLHDHARRDADEDQRSTSTSTAAASSWAAATSVEQWASGRRASLGGGPGPLTTGCRPTFLIRGSRRRGRHLRVLLDIRGPEQIIVGGASAGAISLPH